MYAKTGQQRRSLIGFGLDVSYKDPQGNSKVAQASSAINCSDDAGHSAQGLQQMLNDLGYGPLVVDGQIGTGTFTALDAFAKATGASYTKGSLPQGSICNSVISAWQAKTGVGVATAPASTTAAAAAAAQLPTGFLSTPQGYNIIGLIANSNKKGTATNLSTNIAPSITSSPIGWLEAQSTPVKIGIAVGGSAVVMGIIYALTRHKK